MEKDALSFDRYFQVVEGKPGVSLSMRPMEESRAKDERQISDDIP